jgi:hypothetical protein
MNYFSRHNVPIPDISFEHHRKLISAWMETGDVPIHMSNQTFMAGLLPSEKGKPRNVQHKLPHYQRLACVKY